MKNNFEFGFYTYGDILPDTTTGKRTSPYQRTQEIIEIAKLADQAGFDLIGIGENHNSNFAVSSPIVLLSAIAQATKSIKLSTAVTILSTQDPVRLFKDFATLDLISGGRAEIVVGRGSTTETFPLFGFDTLDYDELFAEKLKLLQLLNHNEKVNWWGKFRSHIDDAEIFPRPLKPLPIWVGVSSTLSSAARAGAAGANLNLAMLTGKSEQYLPYIEIYREAAQQAGYNLQDLKIAVSSCSYLAQTPQQARDEMYPVYSNTMKYHTYKLKNKHYDISRSEFESLTGPRTALNIGSPDEMISKILYQHELFGHSRYNLQMDMNGLPMNKLAKSIELVAEKVMPVIRKVLNNTSTLV